MIDPRHFLHLYIPNTVFDFQSTNCYESRVASEEEKNKHFTYNVSELAMVAWQGRILETLFPASFTLSV